ncbi:hypothetical protein B0T20DRAFT_36111 [Sordaria brevicollis]|uniref:Uncharacterized protein n=1 Tax=Sordaria brevicollis TaxID=83679 RepID=A0AAE0P8X7_SORBR|nr:hypothetical protein B0T20DRAFT_36111 [Sordaria brevicollis]
MLPFRRRPARIDRLSRGMVRYGSIKKGTMSLCVSTAKMYTVWCEAVDWTRDQAHKESANILDPCGSGCCPSDKQSGARTEGRERKKREDRSEGKGFCWRQEESGRFPLWTFQAVCPQCLFPSEVQWQWQWQAADSGGQRGRAGGRRAISTSSRGLFGEELQLRAIRKRRLQRESTGSSWKVRIGWAPDAGFPCRLLLDRWRRWGFARGAQCAVSPAELPKGLAWSFSMNSETGWRKLIFQSEQTISVFPTTSRVELSWVEGGKRGTRITAICIPKRKRIVTGHLRFLAWRVPS